MEFLGLLITVAGIVLLVIVWMAGLAVLRMEKMKNVEHELTYGDPAAAEALRRKHAALIAKKGARRAVATTSIDLRG